MLNVPLPGTTIRIYMKNLLIGGKNGPSCALSESKCAGSWLKITYSKLHCLNYFASDLRCNIPFVRNVSCGIIMPLIINFNGSV
jgi:hypothetical protein